MHFPGEVIEQRFSIRESDRGDAKSAGVLDVVGVLQVVVGDEVDQGLEGVAARLLRVLGAIGGFDGRGEGVFGAEAEFVVKSDNFVEGVPNGVLTEEGQRVHRNRVTGGAALAEWSSRWRL